MTKWACKNCRSLLQRFEDVNERLNTDCFDLKDELERLTTMMQTAVDDARLLEARNTLLEDVAKAAKPLRDHCINNAGTPPAILVCNLDDAIAKLPDDSK